MCLCDFSKDASQTERGASRRTSFWANKPENDNAEGNSLKSVVDSDKSLRPRSSQVEPIFKSDKRKSDS